MRRRLAAPLLVLLALVAIVAVALAPRGLLRATAARHLTPAPAAGEVELAASVDDVHLPGVRAFIGKEEDDAAQRPADAPAGHLPWTPPPARGGAPAPAQGAAAPAPGTPSGEPASGRAPPRPV
jgi:hypothetical protein